MERYELIFNENYSSEADLGKVLLLLRASGASIVICVKLIHDKLNVSLSEADSIVLNSKAWEDHNESTKGFREQFEDAIEEEMKGFRYYSEAEADELCSYFEKIPKDCLDREGKKTKIQLILRNEAGRRIWVNNEIQPGYYVTVILENGSSLSPTEFASANGLSNDLMATHEGQD